jgi:hypothetical protein
MAMGVALLDQLQAGLAQSGGRQDGMCSHGCCLQWQVILLVCAQSKGLDFSVEAWSRVGVSTVSY